MHFNKWKSCRSNIVIKKNERGKQRKVHDALQCIFIVSINRAERYTRTSRTRSESVTMQAYCCYFFEPNKSPRAEDPVQSVSIYLVRRSHPVAPIEIETGVW